LHSHEEQENKEIVGWASVFLLAHRFDSSAWANDRAVCPPYPTGHLIPQFFEKTVNIEPSLATKNTQHNQMSDNHPIKLFFSYSHEDEALRDKLAKHLKLLERQKVIDSWHDRKIEAGAEWNQSIEDNLKAADIILLLISVNSLSSDYCYDIEITHAMQRHEEKSAVVIPISLQPCDTTDAEFMKIQGFPKNFKPVTTWENQEEAFADIAKGIRAVAKRIRSPK
jgi:hypothetical protein